MISRSLYLQRVIPVLRPCPHPLSLFLCVQCMSTMPTTVQFGIPYYEVYNVPGYQALSPECGAN